MLSRTCVSVQVSCAVPSPNINSDISDIELVLIRSVNDSHEKCGFCKSSTQPVALIRICAKGRGVTRGNVCL
jgi:hypothetical protein